VRERYEIGNVARQYEAIYRDLAEPARGKPCPSAREESRDTNKGDD
jgi:hypothetical protein